MCLLVALLVFSAGAALGIYYLITYHQATPAQDPSFILGHVNDTVLLKGGIDVFGYSNMGVQQHTDNADNHDVNIYVINSADVKQKSVTSFRSAETHYQDSPAYKSGILDYLYLLPNSTFTYTFCLASTTNHDQSATFFLFSGEKSYLQYAHDHENGEKYSLYSMNLTANRNNATKCTRIPRRVSSASYYFMMVHSPANISYSYNFSLQGVEYDTSNVEIYCNVSDFNRCPVSLPSKFLQQVKYDILAHIEPGSFGDQTTKTYLYLDKFVTSKNNQIFAIASLVFGGVAMLIGVILLGFLIHWCRNLHRIKRGHY